MRYEEAIDYIHSARGRKEGLSNMRALLHALGNPERDFHALHVAGTNGKGSICAFLHACLREAGYKTGLYTSPYLQKYNERIRLMGMPISDEDLTSLVEEIAEQVERLQEDDVEPTPFELGTALAFLYFSRKRVHNAIIEVGLGGRLDPTNIIDPVVAIIGNIGLDHVNILGEDVKSIAYEKAGIIKPGVPTILYPQGDEVRKVVRKVCEEEDSVLTDMADYSIHPHGNPGDAQTFDIEGDDVCLLDLRIQLPGLHQIKNAATAIAALDRTALVDRWDLHEGIAKAWWPGRLEWKDNILMDGAHNAQGAASLAAYAKEHTQPESTVLIVGMTEGRDVASMADILSPLADTVIATQAKNIRALPPGAVVEAFREREVRVSKDAGDALAMARALSPAHILVTGSLYLIGEMRDLLDMPIPLIP